MIGYEDLPPKFVCTCARCGEQMLKKSGVAVSFRAPRATTKTLCYFCRGCWPKFLEDYGLSEP